LDGICKTKRIITLFKEFNFCFDSITALFTKIDFLTTISMPKKEIELLENFKVDNEAFKTNMENFHKELKSDPINLKVVSTSFKPMLTFSM
jgi:hypothetical protein